jgi:hypothetical protein
MTTCRNFFTSPQLEPVSAAAAPIAVSISVIQPVISFGSVEILARIAESDGIWGEPAKWLEGRSDRVGRRQSADKRINVVALRGFDPAADQNRLERNGSSLRCSEAIVAVDRASSRLPRRCVPRNDGLSLILGIYPSP